MSDPVAGTDPADAHPPRRRSVPVGAFAVAVVVALALGVLAVIALAEDGGGGSADRDVRLAAGRFTERFLTFEHDGLDEWEDAVLALSTRGFAEEVEEVRESLRRLIADGELDAETQVVDVFVGEEDRSSVGVVVIYDRTVRGDEVDRTETDRYLQLSLVRLDGQWLVDDVIDIASAADGGGAPAPPAQPATSSTTTSSAPPEAPSTTAAG